MDRLLNKLKHGILETHSSDFKFKLDEVISMGESPIEKLMLLQLFNYFQKYGKVGNNNDESHFTEIKFIEEEICLWDIDEPLSNTEKKRLEDKIERFNYRHKNGMYYKNIGFECTINRSEGISMNSTDNRLVFRDIEVRPQFYETVDQNTYRIDIVFILKRRDWYNNNEIIDTKKIAIECDGYDYHSSPDQKREDDIRARKLKRGGWKEILRYSGSEIFRINDNLELTHHNFEEIMEIILL
jgi:hypothetical protein